MGMKNKTKSVGSKTQKHTRHSNLDVANKDPNSDYCFRRKKEIEDGGGMDNYGYEAVNATNSHGEEWNGPASMKRKGGKGQMTNQDTVLCKRPLETAKYFKRIEDEKYNAQILHIKNACAAAKDKLRNISPDYVSSATSTLTNTEEEQNDRAFTQRPGVTEE